MLFLSKLEVQITWHADGTMETRLPGHIPPDEAVAFIRDLARALFQASQEDAIESMTLVDEPVFKS